jgi:hypothetical protein
MIERAQVWLLRHGVAGGKSESNKPAEDYARSLTASCPPAPRCPSEDVRQAGVPRKLPTVTSGVAAVKA